MDSGGRGQLPLYSLGEYGPDLLNKLDLVSMSKQLCNTKRMSSRVVDNVMQCSIVRPIR